MIFVGFFAFWVVVTSNSWCMLRISESVPGPQLADTKLRNDPEVSERSWRTAQTSPCNRFFVNAWLLFLYHAINHRDEIINRLKIRIYVVFVKFE